MTFSPVPVAPAAPTEFIHVQAATKNRRVPDAAGKFVAETTCGTATGNGSVPIHTDHRNGVMVVRADRDTAVFRFPLFPGSFALRREQVRFLKPMGQRELLSPLTDEHHMLALLHHGAGE